VPEPKSGASLLKTNTFQFKNCANAGDFLYVHVVLCYRVFARHQQEQVTFNDSCLFIVYFHQYDSPMLSRRRSVHNAYIIFTYFVHVFTYFVSQLLNIRFLILSADKL